MIAKIAVSAATYAIDKPYSYRIPAEMELLPGHRVSVPFGRGNRQAEGIVLSVEPGEEDKLKFVQQLLDDEPLIDGKMLRLAAFVRQRSFCTFYEAIRAMLPGGAWFRTKNQISLTEDRSWKEKTIRKEYAREILEHLEMLGGQANSDQLAAVAPEEENREQAIKYLAGKKWITAQSDFLRRVGDKTEAIATLAASAEEAMEYASRRPKGAAMQKAVLELMCSVGQVSVKELCYFTGASTATVKRLAELGYIALSEKPVLRCSEIKPAKLDGPLILNEEQDRAFQGLKNQMLADHPGVALLYGVTGSGKTSVYLKLIADCLSRGKSAMLLVPEIGLTPQLLSILAAHFGQNVAVLHSSLAATERYDQWKRIRSGKAKVVVGTRSAVFAPCVDLGLIVMDEEQEHTYKSENTPRYSAKEVAIWRGAKEQALVLLGSATPSIESMYRAKNGDYSLYRLTGRYNGRALPEVQIVDQREELRNGNDSPFSRKLLDAVFETWQAGKQSILLLNRRGSSRALVCVDCRESPECPRCTNRLTYHSVNNRLMCHYCGHSQPVTDRCPVCDGPLKPLGTGTQRAQEILNQEFPDMQVLRMDADTVSATNTHEKILSRFREEKIPVLIGTQMVAKGLDLPDVTLVGVLDADLNLYMDSYRAAETTFDMLTQVVGRAGRGESEGKALIQTMVPEHKIIELAAKQDYDGFYDLEIGLRRVTNAPPFMDVATFTFVGENEAAVLRGAAVFRDSLAACLRDPRYGAQEHVLLGPAPCPIMKINYNFRYRLTLRCPLDPSARQLIGYLLRQFQKDKANRGVSAFADINGYE